MQRSPYSILLEKPNHLRSAGLKPSKGNSRLNTILFGKLVGEDNSGNKYYESKSGKRWVIYNGEVEASKIPIEWYSWMHRTGNKIENSHELDKYKWQKEHMSNQTGTENSYHPKKNKSKNATNKKYTSWKS